MTRRRPSLRAIGLLVAGASLLAPATLFGQPAAAPGNVCPWEFLRPTLAEGSGANGILSIVEAERSLIENLEHVCTALVAEDLPTACADGEVLEALSGGLVCGAGGGGGTLTVEEVDGAPTGTAAVLRLDQADGFALTDETGGTFRLDLAAVPLSVLAEDVLTEAELDSEAELEAQIGVGLVAAGEADQVGTTELDDGAVTPAAGDLLRVAAGAEQVEYVTPHAGTDVAADLEEEAHSIEHQAGGADEIQVEDLATTCADGEIVKATPTGTLTCGAAGSAAFTTLDADYGPETYTGPLDMLAGQLHPPGGTAAPAAADCDAAGEAGRVFLDRATAGKPNWWCCEGAAGWTQCSLPLVVQPDDFSAGWDTKNLLFSVNDGFVLSENTPGVVTVNYTPDQLTVSETGAPATVTVDRTDGAAGSIATSTTNLTLRFPVLTAMVFQSQPVADIRAKNDLNIVPVMRVLGGSPAESVRVEPGGVAFFGAGSFGGGAGVVHVANATTAPSTNPANGVILYAEDVAGSAELKVRDESGAVTVLSDLSGAGGSPQMLYVRQEEASGTNGGAATAGVWNTRVLNVEVTDDIGATLATNQVTLPAGTYRVRARGSGCRVGGHRLRLRNITAGTTLALGASNFSDTGTDGDCTDATLWSRVTLAATAAIEIQHWMEVTSSLPSDDMGRAVSTGDIEIHTELWVERE